MNEQTVSLAIGVVLIFIYLFSTIAVLSRGKGERMQNDRHVIRHTAVGIIRLREGQKAPSRYTYGGDKIRR